MTIEDFRILYPALSQSLVDEQIGSNIRLANLLIDKMYISEDLRYEALSLLAAHLTAIDKQGGGSGKAVKTATSKRVGEVQYSYSQQSGDREWYNLTGYGQKLLMLLDLQPRYGGAFVV